MTRKAIFFDRDGCLIVDKHYLAEPSQVEYFNDTFEALKRLIIHNYELFIVTNQSGIGRGMFSKEQMDSVHLKMLADFKAKDIEIKDIAFCPHTPEDKCQCRKPHSLLIDQLCDKYQIDKNGSYMIGDKLSDAKCGENAKVQGCLIHKVDINFPSFNSLSEFVDFVLKEH